VQSPYLNEPGHEGMQEEPSGLRAIAAYNTEVRLQTLRHGMLAHLRRRPSGFDRACRAHFYHKRHELHAQVALWCAEAADIALYELALMRAAGEATARVGEAQRAAGGAPDDLDGLRAAAAAAALALQTWSAETTYCEIAVGALPAAPLAAGSATAGGDGAHAAAEESPSAIAAAFVAAAVQSASGGPAGGGGSGGSGGGGGGAQTLLLRAMQARLSGTLHPLSAAAAAAAGAPTRSRMAAVALATAAAGDELLAVLRELREPEEHVNEDDMWDEEEEGEEEEEEEGEEGEEAGSEEEG
jgi:hypothetical protein